MKAILSFFAVFVFCTISFGQSTGNQVNWYVYNTTNSMLPNNSISSIYVEDNDNIWFGTYSGLAHLDPVKEKWEIYNINSANLGNYIKGIAVDQSKVVWASTSKSGLVSINKGTPTNKASYTYNTSNSGLPTNSLTDIVIDQFDNKWIGTWGHGLVKFNNNTWTVFNEQNSALPHNAINDLFLDNNGNIWVATFNSGIAKFNGTAWTIYNSSNSGLPNDDVLSICVDQNNVVWIGTSNSLVRYDGYNWNVYNMSTVGWPFHYVNDICAGQNGYFATDKGLAIIDSASNWTFMAPSNSGLPAQRITSVKAAGNGYKWLGTLGGGVAVYSESGVSLGLKDTKSKKQVVKIYPNPVSSEISLELNKTEGEQVNVTIYNATGQQVWETRDFNSVSGDAAIRMDVSRLPKGYYIMEIENGDVIATERFIKL